MIAFLAAVCLAQAQPSRPPLPMGAELGFTPAGARFYLERRNTPGKVLIQLWCDTKELPETSATHGWRHVLEHFVSSSDPNFVRRLETKGLFVAAQTTQDSMLFELSCAPEHLDLGLQYMRSLLKPVQASLDEIQREARIIEHEMALVPSRERAFTEIRRALSGGTLLDSGGTYSTMSAMTPQQLVDLQRQVFAPRRLMLMVVGDIQPERARIVAQPVVSSLPWPNPPAWLAPKSESEIPARRWEGFGSAIRSEGLPSRTHLAQSIVSGTLAKNLSLTAIEESTFGPSVMVLWSVDESALKKILDAGDATVQAALLLAKATAKSIVTNLSAYCALQARAIFAGSSSDAEMISMAMERLSQKEIIDALETWKRARPFKGVQP